MSEVEQTSEVVEETTELTPETEALLAKAAETQEALASADPMRPKLSDTQRPDHVPVKFWDPVKGEARWDELAKSYSELEKKVGAPKEESAAEEPEESAEEEALEAVEETTEETSEEETEVTPALAEAVEAAKAAYAETGELSEEARKPLIDAGISNEQIDLYLAGVKAVENALMSKAHEAAGSPEAFAEAVQWAGAGGLTAKQIASFNASTGDVELIGPAVETLMNAFRKANPGEGALVNVNGGVNHGDVYSSKAEFDKDLAEADRLRDQPARKAAIAKLARSRAAKSIKN